jgi:pimeloyl-ACP methyl ester carboxylesterase
MRTDYRSIALDLRGHGDSEWSPTLDYDLTAHAGDVEALVAHLDLDEFVLVGMSLGGMTALEWAGQHGARLAALVLIDIGPEFKRTNAINRFLSETAGEFDSIEAFVEQAMRFNPRRDPALLRRSLLNNVRQTPKGKWVWKHDPRPRVAAAATTETDAELDAAFRKRSDRLWAAVANITAPTLIVRGAQSGIFREEDASKLAGRLSRGTAVVVENAGHTVQGDNPAGLVRELRTFLRAANL